MDVLISGDAHNTNMKCVENAEPFLKDSQASWSCISGSWACRKASETPRRSWSCWRSTPPSVCLVYLCSTWAADQVFRTNFDKYHPGYFGKVGMRRFHLMRNVQWNPTINVDKLWTLVPEEHKKDLKKDSQVVPVVNVLHHGYSKVLGNGRLVFAAWNRRCTRG